MTRSVAARSKIEFGFSRISSEQHLVRRRSSHLDEERQFNRHVIGSHEEELQGVYIISVAARILAMHPQTLRKYERLGLVRPSRTVGMLRLYSESDIARLELIKHLVGDIGLNLAGVRMAMRLFNQLLEVQNRLNVLDGKDLKNFLVHSVEDMLTTLRTSIR